MCSLMSQQQENQSFKISFTAYKLILNEFILWVFLYHAVSKKTNVSILKMRFFFFCTLALGLSNQTDICVVVRPSLPPPPPLVCKTVIISVVVETVSETSHLCWNNETIRFKSSLTSIIIECTYLTLNFKCQQNNNLSVFNVQIIRLYSLGSWNFYVPDNFKI